MATRKAATKAAAAPAQAAPTKDQLAQEVTKLRNSGMSWAAIGAQFNFAPRTARSLYQRANGAHSHHGTLPGKGGRYPQGYVAPTADAVKGAHATPWVPRTAPNGAAGTMGAAVPAEPAKAPARRTSKKAAAK